MSKRTTKTTKSGSAPDPTVMRVIEQLAPMFNEYLNREAATSHLRMQVHARELELRERELDLRFKQHALEVTLHEQRAAEQEVELAERRQRLEERRASIKTPPTDDFGVPT